MKTQSEFPCPDGCKREGKPVMVKVRDVCPECGLAIPSGAESTFVHYLRRHGAFALTGMTRKHIHDDASH
ncbi:MAG: hypothetical protein WC519_00735 [Parcubacteria group bacterium]